MRFGHFDDERREYVITTPRTPLPWINYLGSEDFFVLLSNTAGGYAFYRDARLRRLTRYRYNASPLDADGFHIYVRDGAAVWNPGWQPVQTEPDGYSCRHGLGYTVLEGEKDGINVSQELFVPRGDTCLLMRVTVQNRGESVRSIQLYPYVEFCLWDAMDDGSNFQRNLSIGEVEVEGNAIYHKTEYRERRDHYAVFWSNRRPDGYDTAREAFLGVYGSPMKPEAVINGGCTGSVAHGWQPVAAQQYDLTLSPGEACSIIFGLGYIENPEEEKWSSPGVINKTRAEAMMARYADDSRFDAALSALAAFWEELLGGFRVETGSGELDRMVNIWHQYQCMVTFNMSRSASYYESGMGRGMGFRDSCQDLLGFVHMIPGRARERILDIAATQLPDGSAYHQYQPLTKRGNSDIGSGFNDDPLWLIAGTDAYLRETGDWSILDEAVPFDNDASLSQPLMEHLRRSFRFTMTHLGPHGLPLIGRADWNDCLNLNCFSTRSGESFQTSGPSEGPVAESVFIAAMFVKYGRAWADICRHAGLADEAAEAEAAAAAMEGTVLDAGWDGAWFRRAYDAFGAPVGSRECEEGQIYIEPQGMCVMAGIGVKTGEAAAALRSVEDRLETKYGIVLLQPATSAVFLSYRMCGASPPAFRSQQSAAARVADALIVSDGAGPRGAGIRAVQTHLSGLSGGDQRHPPNGALRVQPDGRGEGRAVLRRGQKQLAHRHGGVVLCQRQPIDPRHPSDVGRPSYRPLRPPRLEGLHRDAALPGGELSYPRRESVRRGARRRPSHRERRPGGGQPHPARAGGRRGGGHRRDGLMTRLRYEGAPRSSDRNDQGVCDACRCALLRAERRR